jgi:hypothetical protein
MNGFAYHPQRGIVMSLEGHYRATVHLPEARFETDWADSCVWLPKTGIEVLVVFVNGDQNRPVIVGRFPTETEEGTPSMEIGIGGASLIQLGDSETSTELAGGGKPIARVGDYIEAATGTYTDPDGNEHTIIGRIVSGSSKVTTG